MKSFTERERRERARTAAQKPKPAATGSLAELQRAAGNHAFGRMLSAPNGARLLQRWFGFRLPIPARTESQSFTATCTVEGGAGFSKKKTFPILSFHWGVAQSHKRWEESEQKKPKSEVSDFALVKRMDEASPHLLKAAAVGEKIAKVEVVLSKGSTKVVHTFEGVYVTSVRPGGAGGGGDPLEEVSFNFETVSHGY